MFKFPMTDRISIALILSLSLFTVGAVYFSNVGVSSAQTAIPSSIRSKAAFNRTVRPVESELKNAGFELGSKLYLRIFKKERLLEAWLEKNGRFQLFKTYPICTWSGRLGPKIREGDYQSPEGFYFLKPNSMNPSSSFHLSFNLGFPNAYDRSKGRTGSYLMIHGNCVSVGCYAMTDGVIEKLWVLTASAFRSGQPFIRVHIFPFRMTDRNMDAYAGSRWYRFWENLRQGHDLFHATGRPPNTIVRNRRYVFEAAN